MRRLALIAACAAAIACGKPPTREIAAVEQQIERARAAGAERYAPEPMKQAEASLALARQRVESGDYRDALSAANAAGESARVALEQTGPAKKAAHDEAQIELAAARAVLDRAATERAAAIKAGVPRATLARLDARGEQAAQQIAAADEQLKKDNLSYVAQMTEVLRNELTPLPDLYKKARTQAESKRPRPRARGTARRPSR